MSKFNVVLHCCELQFRPKFQNNQFEKFISMRISNTFTKSYAVSQAEPYHAGPISSHAIAYATIVKTIIEKKKLLIFFLSFIKLKCKPAINWLLDILSLICVYTSGHRDRPKISAIQFWYYMINASLPFQWLWKENEKHTHAHSHAKMKENWYDTRRTNNNNSNDINSDSSSSNHYMNAAETKRLAHIPMRDDG